MPHPEVTGQNTNGPFVATVNVTMAALKIGQAKTSELINSGELESYLGGGGAQEGPPRIQLSKRGTGYRLGDVDEWLRLKAFPSHPFQAQAPKSRRSRP
jgi:hypothetical protein